MDAQQPLDLGFVQAMQPGIPSVVPPDSLAWGRGDNPIEGWDGNVLDAFEQYLDSTPNVDPASYGSQRTSGATQPPAFGQSSGDSHSHPELSKTMSSNERKQQNNRAAQKRFRARQKAKSQTIEVQLAETTAQLNELKVKQKQLEARNALLEKVAALNRQPSSGSSPCLGSDDNSSWPPSLMTTVQNETNAALKGLAVDSDRGPLITITILDEDKVMTVKEAGSLSMQEFAKFYSAYARKLGACLLEATGDETPAAQQLRRWTMELTSLMVCYALCSSNGFMAFHQANMEDGTADVRELDESFYLKLLMAIDLTEAQQRDMLYLRRLFFGKLGQLARERKAMIARLHTDPMTMRLCHASDKLTEMERLAEQLRANGAEEYRTYVQLSSAFYRGIQTTSQHAIGIVHSYPWIPEKGRILEVMAAQMGEPSSEVLMQPNGLDDLQHAANWQEIEDYLVTVNMTNLQFHVPLVKETSSLSSDTHLGSF